MQLAQGADVEYRFHDVRVDTRAHSVTRAGVELSLEPKAYAVLLQLLARPGAVLTRDELLDSVWGHRHVTPAVLNRVIAMLRRELGDEADHPTTIRTVHGVGYALIAPVTRLARPPEASTNSPPPVESPRGAVETSAADVIADGSAAPTVATDGAREEPAGSQPVSLPAARRRWGSTALIALLVVVAVLLAWRWWPTADEREEPGVEVAMPAVVDDAATITLAVQPFEAEGDDAGLREVAAGLTDSVAEALARLANVRVTESESTALAAASAPGPQEVARALSVAHVLGATLRVADPTHLELQLALYVPGSAAPTWTHVVRQERAQPFRMLGPALDAIASSPIGRGGKGRPDPALSGAIDAQDLYWLGRQRLARRDFDSWRRARVLFERAVEIDPAYAMAWTSIAEVHRALANAGQEPLLENARNAFAALDRALAIDPNLVDAYVLKALISTMQWRPHEGHAAAQRALELAPNRPDVLALNGNIEYYVGRPRAARVLHHRALEGNPLSSLSAFLAAQDCMMLGDEPCARAEFDEALRIGGGALGRRLTDLRIDMAFGHLASALAARSKDISDLSLYTRLDRAKAWSMLRLDEATASTFAQIPPQESAVPLYISVILDRFWHEGRWADALRWAEDEGGPATQDPWRSVWIAQARVLAGQRAEGLRDYDRVLADPDNRALLASSWFATRAGIGQVANWIALRRQAGQSYDAELAALRAETAAMIEGGVDLPAFDYHRAVAAVLSGDMVEADKRLARAIERGWLDDVAFDTDFVWREFETAPWLAAHRAQIRSRLGKERAAVLAAMPKTAAAP